MFGSYSYHNITFGKLSEADFLNLKAYYKFPISSDNLPKLTYDPNKSYKLLDFLVPKIQPLPGTILWSGIKTDLLQNPTLSEREYTYFSTNCWSTVHDVLLSDQNPFEIFGYVTDSNYYGANVLKVLTDDSSTINVAERNDLDLKAYDYFIQPDEDIGGIFHTGIFIGPGLIFEKLGLGPDEYKVSPFLINYDQENADKWREKLLFRRLTKTLPTHPWMISSNSETTNDDIYWQNPLTVSYDANESRYVFDPSGLASKLFRQPILRSCDFDSQENGLCKKNINSEPVKIDF